MAKTPNGGLTAYAAAADFTARFDDRIVGDLVRDDGTQAGPTDLLTDPNLAAALADASGLVESACLAGEMYAAADLQALTGNGLALLKRIVCGLAINYLRQRRGVIEESDAPPYVEAKAFLQDLRDGKRIFPFAETEAAGLPSVRTMTSSDWTTGLPSLLTNNPRAWGVRSNRR